LRILLVVTYHVVSRRLLVFVFVEIGHGDTSMKEEPTLIEALKGKDIVDVECGGTYR
jgi:hypothetical protein